MDYYTKARVFFYELVSPKEENKEPLARRITRIEDDWLKDRRNASEYDLQGKNRQRAETAPFFHSKEVVRYHSRSISDQNTGYSKEYNAYDDAQDHSRFHHRSYSEAPQRLQSDNSNSWYRHHVRRLSQSGMLEKSSSQSNFAYSQPDTQITHPHPGTHPSRIPQRRLSNTANQWVQQHTRRLSQSGQLNFQRSAYGYAEAQPNHIPQDEESNTTNQVVEPRNWSQSGQLETQEPVYGHTPGTQSSRIPQRRLSNTANQWVQQHTRRLSQSGQLKFQRSAYGHDSGYRHHQSHGQVRIGDNFSVPEVNKDGRFATTHDLSASNSFAYDYPRSHSSSMSVATPKFASAYRQNPQSTTRYNRSVSVSPNMENTEPNHIAYRGGERRPSVENMTRREWIEYQSRRLA